MANIQNTEMIENIIFEIADIANFRIGQQVNFLKWSVIENFRK